MQLFQIIGVSVLGLFLFVTRTEADNHCEASDDKISACTKIFVGVNTKAKNATACLKDEIKGSCISYKLFKTCVDIGKDASKNAECKTKISEKLKAEGIGCTFDEVVSAVMCGGSTVTFNLALFVCTALLAIIKF
ncbi:uncharacterized protein LOC124291140 [Haliotis rubra]|uniref:uncharacterized protein LOC124291140 n=1 Tax=Haliotis rubra TaxID=36100 RepID=UPI001EE4F8B2|nr:uncharacterized protein LOC124291140 [Haliotis rubra]